MQSTPVNGDESNLIKTIQDIKVIDEGLQNSSYSLELIFKGSRDGFKSADFNRLCIKPNTLSVVESEFGKVFGGFTSLAWQTNAAAWKPDEKAWIFSLTHRTVHRQY